MCKSLTVIPQFILLFSPPSLHYSLTQLAFVCVNAFVCAAQHFLLFSSQSLSLPLSLFSFFPHLDTGSFYFNQTQSRFHYSVLFCGFLHFSLGLLCFTLREMIWCLKRSFWAGWTDGSFFHKSSWLRQRETKTLQHRDDDKSCGFKEGLWCSWTDSANILYLYAGMEILPTYLIINIKYSILNIVRV